LATRAFNIPNIVGSKQKLTQLTRLSRLQKETTEFFQAQTARIKAAKDTGVA
jgi:dihydrodipicolinate synthase/N-acetylneuraminate lyase